MTSNGNNEKSAILLQIFPRLDSIMFGVLGAFTSLYYKKIWNHYNHWKWFVAMFLTLFLIKFLNSNNESFYFIVLSPTFKAIAVLMMIPFLSNWKINPENKINRFITFISLTSYSIYLINRTIVIDIILKYGMNGDLKRNYVASTFWGVEYLLFWVLTPILAYFVYRFVEQPFMKLRKKNN